MATDRRAFDLALSICDGAPADWEDEGAEEIDAALRDIERISAFHRSLGNAPGARIWGRLELLESLGSGTRGEVWRAWDPDLRRNVALKLLRFDRSQGERWLDALMSEGQLTAKVQHPNIVTIHAIERHGDSVGLSMELIEGSTLLQILDTQGPLSAAEAALIGRQLCGAVGAIHRAGLLHCDIKAQNVMRQVGGRIVLMDFSSGMRSRPEERSETFAGTSGTPLYMAPEFLSGGDATPATDVYALGVLLFFLTTGTFPVTASTLEELEDAHRLQRRRHIRDVRPDLSQAFVDAVEAAVDPNPLKRPASVGALERLLASSVGEPPALPDLHEDERSPKKRTVRIVSWVVAAALLAAALITWQAWSPTTTGSREFQVDVRLFRTHDGTVAEVADGDRFALGDLLRIRYTADVPSWLYVVNEDESGRLLLLYPRKGMAGKDPLAPNVAHEIPHDAEGRPLGWQLDLAGGTEQLLLVASAERLIDLEADLLALDSPTIDGTTGITELEHRNEAARRRLRGFGTVVPLQGAASTVPHADFVGQVYTRLDSGPARARGVYARRVALEGPNR